MNRLRYKKQCSQCGSSNYKLITKDTTRGQETIIKCFDCQHEKVEFVMTTTNGIYTTNLPSSIMNYKHNGIEYF